MHAEEESLAAEVNPRVRGLFLKNLADFQTELARVHAGFVPAVPVWPQRKELPMLIFRSLRRVQDVRLRGRELGVSFADMHVSRSVAGRALLDELCGAATVADFYAAAMVVVPRKLITAISDYLERNQSVYDLPSVALLVATRDELKSQAGGSCGNHGRTIRRGVRGANRSYGRESGGDVARTSRAID